MPDHVIDHIIKKYGHRAKEVGHPDTPGIGIPKIKTETPWELVQQISRCNEFIGIDSGPAWIATCFPHIKTKKLHRITKEFEKRMQLDPRDHVTWFYDSTLAQFYNTTDKPIHFTESYLDI